MRGLRRILIVDDDPALRQSLAEQLERHGEFATVECDSATTALATIRGEHSDAAVLTIGPYSFQPGAKLMIDSSGRKKVRLTEKETAILKYLYRAGDRVIGRDTLLGEVWGYNAGVTTHTLETHVYRLRQKIERDPTHAELLVTEPGD